MNVKSFQTLFRFVSLVALLAWVPAIAGCATSKEPKPETVHQRGWIGGEYTRVLGPKSLAEPLATANTNHVKKPKSPHGLLITALVTNSPAYLAGLREGDLLLELDQKPVARLTTLHEIVDQAGPGTPLAIKVYRGGATSVYTVPAGRETFKNGGLFGIELPFYSERFDFWPNPDFSLCVLGFKTTSGDREELGSVENTYRRESLGWKDEPYNSRWQIWLVIFAVERGEHIVSQEPVPPE